MDELRVQSEFTPVIMVAVKISGVGQVISWVNRCFLHALARLTYYKMSIDRYQSVETFVKVLDVCMHTIVNEIIFPVQV